jgi:hypothetical protein
MSWSHQVPSSLLQTPIYQLPKMMVPAAPHMRWGGRLSAVPDTCRVGEAATVRDGLPAGRVANADGPAFTGC